MISLIALALLLAPASQPAGPLPGERVVDNTPLRFHFAVPKAWKEVPQNAAAVVYVFQLPATGESRRTMPTLIVTAADIKDRTLAAEVDGRRTAIKAHNGDPKFDEDAAATIAGHDGWTFVYGTMLKQTVTSNGQSHEEKIAVKVRDQLTVINGRDVEFVLTSEEKGLPIRSRMIDRVTSTLVVNP